jgi:DNA-binding NarL/FixJ family response regulator
LEAEDMSENDPAGLSRREMEVLSHLQQGLTNRQIADRLYISTNTINKHVQQVLRKLGVSNRVQAAVRAGSFAGVSAG